MIANTRQLRAMCPTGAKVILTVSFEPADCRTPRKNLRVMLSPEADSSGQRRTRFRGPLPEARGAGTGQLQVCRAHLASPHLLGVSEPPTMRSQVPFGSSMNSLGLLSLLL